MRDREIEKKWTESCIKVRTKKLSKYLPMILTQLGEIINLTPTSNIVQCTSTKRDHFSFISNCFHI